MSNPNTVAEISQKTSPIFEKYGIQYAGLFGSYARGDNKESSDIDILFERGIKSLSLFDLMEMKEELSNVLNKDVDLVSTKAVIPYFKEYIFSDLKIVYGKR